MAVSLPTPEPLVILETLLTILLLEQLTYDPHRSVLGVGFTIEQELVHLEATVVIRETLQESKACDLRDRQLIMLNVCHLLVALVKVDAMYRHRTEQGLGLQLQNVKALAGWAYLTEGQAVLVE